jgi:hypothetical protein
MNDVATRAREAAERLRKAVESSALAGLVEERQQHLTELLGQVQNAELRAKITAVFDQQQKTVAELAHTVQSTVAAQQQHLSEALAALEGTLREQRARAEEVDPVDDLTDDGGDDETPRMSPFAHVPGAAGNRPEHPSGPDVPPPPAGQP